jgi:hypothetical protein
MGFSAKRTTIVLFVARRTYSWRTHPWQPQLEKKLRVAFDLTLDLIFSKDLVRFQKIRAPMICRSEDPASHAKFTPRPEWSRARKWLKRRKASGAITRAARAYANPQRLYRWSLPLNIAVFVDAEPKR